MFYYFPHITTFLFSRWGLFITRSIFTSPFLKRRLDTSTSVPLEGGTGSAWK